MNCFETAWEISNATRNEVFSTFLGVSCSFLRCLYLKLRKRTSGTFNVLTNLKIAQNGVIYSWYVWSSNMYSTKVSIKANEAWGSVHTPGEYEKAVHTNPSRQRSFSEMLFKPSAFRFRVNVRHFKNGVTMTSRLRDFSDRLFLKHEFKTTGDGCGKHLMDFRSVDFVFIFLRHSVAGAW